MSINTEKQAAEKQAVEKHTAEKLKARSSFRMCLTGILLCLSLLSGCGGKNSVEEQENLPPADWQLNGFAVSGEVVEEQGLWVEEYIPWNHDGVTWDEETEELYTYGAEDIVTCGGKIYRLSPILRNENNEVSRCFLEVYDAAAMEASIKELDLDRLEITETKGTRKVLHSMDVIGENNLAFHVIDIEASEDESGSRWEFRQLSNDIVYLGSEGERESRAELLPFMLEAGIVQETDRAIRTGDWNCDGAGNNYIRTGPDSNPYQKLYILSNEGQLIMEHKVSDQEQINTFMKTAGGELIFSILNNEKRNTSIVWFDVQNKQVQTLAILEGEFIRQLYGMQGNDLYYENYLGIVKWDIASGSRQLVFPFDENGIDNNFQTMMVMREGRTPVLRTWGTSNGETEDWMMVLKEEPVERPDAVRLVSLTDESNRVKNSVAIAGRRNPNSTFVYESRENADAGDYRTRIIAELAAGGGPELMYVSLEDMELLYERGMLADLRDYVKKETLDEVLHGVLEMGTVDGSLVGMAPEISASSLRVGKSTWSGDSWTLDDIVELMDSGKLEGKIFYQDFGGYFADGAVLNLLLEYSLGDSFLIDWEKGESHFDDARFIKLMECIGKYDDIFYDGPWDERVRGGGSLMVFEDITIKDVTNYAGIHESVSSHYVGFPTEHGNGNYLEAPGVIVVNKNVSDSSAVSAYLECLLGSEVQMNTSGLDIYTNHYGLPVTPLPTDNIRYDSETGEASWNHMSLNVYEDGTNSIQAINAFLEQCVPAPGRYADIIKIINEELSAYWAGDKSVNEVVKIIDNRVQVYLDERN